MSQVRGLILAAAVLIALAVDHRHNVRPGTGPVSHDPGDGVVSDSRAHVPRDLEAEVAFERAVDSNWSPLKNPISLQALLRCDVRCSHRHVNFAPASRVSSLSIETTCYLSVKSQVPTSVFDLPNSVNALHTAMIRVQHQAHICDLRQGNHCCFGKPFKMLHKVM